MEHQNQYYLRSIINDYYIDQKFIFNSPTENPFLKECFKSSSKKNTGNKGFPDLIYFDEKTLIIFECKREKNLEKAIKEAKYYKDKVLCSLEKKNLYNIYYCGFISEKEYKIFNYDEKEYKNTIQSLCLKNNIKFDNKESMEKNIKFIHNYIRNNTKISNEDKSLFVSSILISLMNDNFKNVISNSEEISIDELILDLLYKKGLDKNIFKFISSSLDNNHLFFLSKKISEINLEGDLLNKFYSEFTSYSNTDGKSLGIILTPDHIIKLMVRLLNINNKDTVLDLCSGTGSFIWECLKYSPKKAIGVEYQHKLFNLLKCNKILFNDNVCELINDDCFNHNYKCSKSIINPPFGQKQTELDFIIKQLDSLEENGLCCAILPKSKLNNNVSLNKKKKEIMKKGIIKCIINCNNNLFSPSATVSCCIILIEKNSSGHCDKDKVKIFEYEDDGIINMIHNGKMKADYFDKNFEKVFKDLEDDSNNYSIDLESDWYIKNEVKDDNFLDITELKIRKLKLEMEKQINQIRNEVNIIKFEKYKTFLINNVFEILTCKRTTLTYVKENKGNIPYISSSCYNNGITGYTDKITHKKNCITLANSGSVGFCFFQDKDFCGTDSIYILILKDYEINFKIGKVLCELLEKIKHKYSFNRSLRLCRLNKEYISLPVTDKNIIDFKKLEDIYDKFF